MPQLIRELQEIWEAEQLRRNDFYDWVSPDIKAEFIDGEVVVHSPILLKHNLVTGALFKLLDTYVLQNKLGFVGIEKIMSRFTRNDYEPDIVFFGKEKSAQFQSEQTIFPVPDFIVEVLSDSTEERDRGVKFTDYALHQVAEYWIIDAETETIEQYFLEDGSFRLHASLQNGLIESRAVAGFRIPVRAIFDGEMQISALKDM